MKNAMNKNLDVIKVSDARIYVGQHHFCALRNHIDRVSYDIDVFIHSV